MVSRESGVSGEGQCGHPRYENADLPKLLRAIAGGTDAKETRLDVIFNAAAAEIDQLRGMVADDTGTWQDLWKGERAANDRLLATLNAACGYLINASIDLTTGAPKKTALNTIEGGLKMIRSAITAAVGDRTDVATSSDPT